MRERVELNDLRKVRGIGKKTLERIKEQLIYEEKGYISEYTRALHIEKNSVSQLLHPTQKPVKLFEYLIKTYTDEGDLVLDNVAGSGTTGVACMNTGRNYILIEKEKDYFEKTKERLGEIG